MPSPEIQRLWKLHQIDAAIQDVRNQAAHLDVGQAIQAEIERIQKEEEVVGSEAKKLHAEQTDLELANKTIEDKLKKIDKEMYGGSVVNAREVQNLEKEIEILKRQRGTNDARILELWELVPPAQERAKKVQAKVEEAKKRLSERRKGAMAEKSRIEAEYKRLTALRPEASIGISPTLLARYEDVRKKHGGIGMAQVNLKDGTCSGCGTHLPERTRAALKDDRVMVCETCRRILYYTEGLV